MDKYMNKITLGNSFELINKLDKKSIDLLLTDPPYFFSGGYKKNTWDNIKSIITPDEKNQLDNCKNNKERETVVLKVVHRYFSEFIDLVLPVLKDDASLVIFNKLEHVEFMQKYLNKYYASWESHIFEWSKTNPSPKVKEKNKSEYALIATNITGVGDNWNFARLPEFSNNNEFFGSQITAKPPSKNELTSYMKLTKHDTPKPYALWKELIRTYSNAGNLILDPFSGSGTTALVATDLSRNFIAFEKFKEYYKSSTDRLEKFMDTIPKSLFL